ncbi:MAG TPA: polysaccharide biosynthesis/export family protein [Vicinamibacteria bacterium]|nr:polysaccharide biosynthesis/export family protein [Vicinamibacteria bacterium]
MARMTPLLGGLLLAAWAAAQDSYEIGPRDVIHLVVLGQDSLTGDFAVDPDGMLTLPVLGKVKAADLTPQELERKLTTLLADGYLKRPQVSLSMKEYHSQRVFVTGEVQRPGPYPLKADRTLLALLGDLGGPGPNAGHEVVIYRPAAPSEAGPANLPVEIPTDAEAPVTPSGAAAETIRVSLKRLQAGELDQNVELRAGDTVYFPPARQVYVSGQVARPGPYKFQEGMTVLQVLTLAGGVSPRGAAGRTKIVRTVKEDGEEKRKELKAKMEDLVEPDDSIVVPERFF